MPRQHLLYGFRICPRQYLTWLALGSLPTDWEEHYQKLASEWPNDPLEELWKEGMIKPPGKGRRRFLRPCTPSGEPFEDLILVSLADRSKMLLGIQILEQKDIGINGTNYSGTARHHPRLWSQVAGTISLRPDRLHPELFDNPYSLPDGQEGISLREHFGPLLRPGQQPELVLTYFPLTWSSAQKAEKTPPRRRRRRPRGKKARRSQVSRPEISPRGWESGHEERMVSDLCDRCHQETDVIELPDCRICLHCAEELDR